MTERRSPRESGTPPLRFPPSLGGGGSASRALSQAHRASDYRVRPKPGGRDLDEGVIRSRGRRQPPTNAFPGCGRGRPRSQGGRQSRTWRCARPRARSPQGDERRCIPQPPADTVPGCGRGRPRSQGGRQSRTWRCARPRARSPQGDERRCIPQPPADTVPGCGRGRPRSQGGRPANPGPGDALVPERGARRATGSNAYPNRRPTRPPDAGETPALPGGAQSRTWRCARPRARSPQGDERRCIRQPPADTAPGCGRDARAPREGEPAETLRLGSVAAA
jgi:hypothetical protein